MTVLARVSEERRGEVVIASIDGEIDLSNASDLAGRLEAMLENTDELLVVDLTETRYLDSAGLTALFRLDAELQGRRQRLRLVIPENSPVRRTVALTGLDEQIELHPALEEALAAGAGPGAAGRP